MERQQQEEKKNNDDGEFNPPSSSARRWLVGGVAGASLVAGVMSAVAVKMQNRVELPICKDCQDGPREYFDQPYWQSFIMFSGESLCLIVWWIEVWWRDREGRQLMYIEFPNTEASFNKPRTPYWWWIFPALADLMSTTFFNMAYTMTYASTVLVLSNTQLLFAGTLSIVLMRRPLRLYEWFGLVIMTVAMGVASIRAIRSPESETNTDADRAWIGVILTILGAVIGAMQVTIEEWYYKRRYFPPMGSMGLQGLFGLIMSAMAIVITDSLGIYEFRTGWYQMNVSGRIMAGNLSHIVSSLICNGAGLCTTKLGSAMLRSVVWALRSPVVWVVELVLGWQAYSWEQLVALILSGFGFCVYILWVPGLSRSSKFHQWLRRQIPCFCIKPVVDPENNEEPIIAHKENEFCEIP